MSSLNDRTVTLIGPLGVTDVALTPVEQGMLLFITPRQDLLPGSDYTLFISGAADTSGRALPFVARGFFTARLSGSPSASGFAVSGPTAWRAFGFAKCHGYRSQRGAACLDASAPQGHDASANTASGTGHSECRKTCCENCAANAYHSCCRGW